MLFASFFKWWFVDGWHRQLMLIERRFARLTDIFSFSLLIKTLFSPFRQISSGSVRGSLNAQLGAWRDRTISRAIGFAIRIFTLIAGVIVLTGYLVFGMFRLIIWGLLPFIPVAGLVLSLGGVPLWNE